MALKFSKADADNTQNQLHVVFSNGCDAIFPYVWLHDNAPADGVFEIGAKTSARALLMKDLDSNMTNLSCAISGDGTSLTITWPKQTNLSPTNFHANWLSKRILGTDASKQQRNCYHEFETQPWSCERISKELAQIDWNDLVNEKEKPKPLRDFLKAFLRDGLAKVVNVPQLPGQLEKLTTVFGFNEHSHYGGYFDVKTKTDPSNLAYTAKTLGLHTDLPFLERAPDVQVLHVVRQSAAGGENEFVDGLEVARQLKHEKPKVYELLTTIEQEFQDDGEDHGFRYMMAQKHHTIELDKNGNPVQVFYNNQVRSWYCDASLEHLRDYYAALRTFNDYAYQQRNMFQVKLNAGEMIFFANNRVLHGRKGYKPSKDAVGERHLQGGYYTFDALRSKIRVLTQRAGELTHAGMA